jgi:S-DNA-T family DNA segregation ATPase FtsK/SpoIIIE
MVLGEGARDMGATADHINEQTPGVAFVRIEGTRAIRRVRASYLTDDDIHALAGSVTASPALTAPRAPKPVDPLDSWPTQATPSTAPDAPSDAAAKPRKPRSPRKPRNRDGSQVA